LALLVGCAKQLRQLFYNGRHCEGTVVASSGMIRTCKSKSQQSWNWLSVEQLSPIVWRCRLGVLNN
jgi:hypothetical protein